MTTYNNSDILMVPYEDLPDEDKGVIGKAIGVSEQVFVVLHEDT